jgi:hypothetical protein
VKLNNSLCVYSVQYFTCETAATYFCDIADAHYPGDCISCGSSASLPLSACAPYEGSRCELDRRAGTNCEDVPKSTASCTGTEIAPGIIEYFCGEFKPGGSCDATSNFLPCY